MRLLFHAVLIVGFFVGGDLLLNRGQATHAFNIQALKISKEFQREVSRLID